MSRRAEFWQQLLQFRNHTTHHLRALLGAWPGLLTITLLLFALIGGAIFLTRTSDDAAAQSTYLATLAQLATRMPTLPVTVVTPMSAIPTKSATPTATITRSPTPTWTPQPTATQLAASPLQLEALFGRMGTPLAPLPANLTGPEITGPQIVPVDVITATVPTSGTLTPPLTPTISPPVTPTVDALLLLVPTPTPTPTPSIVEALEQPVTVGGLAGMVATATAIAPVSAESAAHLPAATDADAAPATNTEVELPPTPVSQPTPDGDVRTVSVPILMYHYLSTPPANADIYRQDLSVTPELFAAQLDALQQAGYTTISLYTLLDSLTHGTPLPEKPVVLTFDDGYRDNYENAFPLLRDRGFTATFFLVTDFINTERPEYMTWDMAREMYAAGMSIEGHGRNHVSLANKDNDYLIWQALGTYESIELEVGVRPRFIAYPAGEYDQRTIEIFRSANYWAGFTTNQGTTHSSDDLFQIRRVRVRGTTSPEELLRILALDW